MSDYRHSIWDMMIEPLKKEIVDASGAESWTYEKLRECLIRAMINLPSMTGAATKVMIPFGFEPLDSDGGLRTDIFQNDSNITTNYGLALTASGTEGYVETVAMSVPTKQILLVTLYWTEAGSVGPTVLDISLNKSPGDGEQLVGTFLNDDGRIPTIASGVPIDTSMIPSSSFSIKWTLPSNSDYTVKETIAEIILVDTLRMNEQQGNIINMAAVNIFKVAHADAIAAGAGTGYVEKIESKIQSLIGEVQGNMGKGVVLTSTVGALGHNVDRDKFASRAFGKKRPDMDGQWVEITGNTITGRRLLIIPD
jgi:hypothetical protein